MTKKANAPAWLRGFQKHGVAFSGTVGGTTQQQGDCIFCGGEGKLYVNEENGLWDCKVCGRAGDYPGFLREVAALRSGEFSGAVANRLSSDKGVAVGFLRRLGTGYDPVGGFYTVPVYGPPTQKGKVPTSDLRIYVPGKKTLSSPGARGGLITATDNANSQTVWICEGEWDTAAWLQTLRTLGIADDVYGLTGANNFPKELISLFRGKDVRLLLDHDDAGRRGTARLWGLLGAVVGSRHWVNWPDDTTPDKFDLRDLFLQKGKRAQEVYDRVNELLDARAPNGDTPAEGVAAADVVPESKMTGQGMSRDAVEEEYKKWLHIEDPSVLDVMFGSLFANRIDSDPFWLFLVAPSSGSKSEFLMTLSDAPNIYTITSITPHALISGSFGAGGDPSLIPEIIGKVLVIKDFTTILSMPQAQRDEIFGILRDAYDGKIEKKFGNSVHRRYTGTFGILAGVTSAIEMYTQTSLGERFMKYRIKRVGVVDTGRPIIMRAMMNIGKEKEMRSEMREVAARVMNRPVGAESIPVVPPEFYDQTVMLAQWVAAMRGQVVRDHYRSTVQYIPEQETGARLGKQLMTFGMGVSIFRGETTMSAATMALVREVARCTSPDKAERIVETIYRRAGNDYVDLKEMSAWTRLPHDTCKDAMENLEILNILDREPSALLTRHRWRLTDTVHHFTQTLGMYERGRRNGPRRKSLP